MIQDKLHPLFTSQNDFESPEKPEEGLPKEETPPLEEENLPEEGVPEEGASEEDAGVPEKDTGDLA